MFFVFFVDFEAMGVANDADADSLAKRVFEEVCFDEMVKLFKKKTIEEAYFVEPVVEQYKNYLERSFKNDFIMIASNLNFRIGDNFNSDEIEKLMRTQYDFLYKEDLSFFISSPKYSKYLFENINEEKSLKKCIQESKNLFVIDTVI